MHMGGLEVRRVLHRTHDELSRIYSFAGVTIVLSLSRSRRFHRNVVTPASRGVLEPRACQVAFQEYTCWIETQDPYTTHCSVLVL
jgi:hypothetical protein